MLRLAVLGQLRITLGDQPPLDLASEKMAALLVYLALTGELYARPQLEALLWGESPPEKAQTSLRTAVYKINKQLKAPLQTTRKSVSFAPQRPFTIDANQFSDLIARGDVASLETAVSLYRGDLLAGLTIADAPEFEIWLLQKRERLRLDMLAALETLIEQNLADGRLPAAIQYARRLLEIEPWRESIHRQLMLLLARSGDYNGAIKQYQQCRAMLADELDMPPMPETEALHERIVVLRRRPPKLKLPSPPPVLIGRERELAALTSMLAADDCRLIAIVGMGGIGKTSVAMALAAHHARRFLDGVFFVPLAEVETENLLETAVADALDIDFPPGVELRDYLCQQLREKELLLVLDNAEHLLTAVSFLTQSLLRAAPDLNIVLTSREKPRLRAANLLTLTGLPLPNASATAIAPAPAAELFLQNARRLRHDFSLEREWAYVVELCRLVGGSPLGIELAAAQLETATCRELVERLSAAAVELAVDFEDMPPRHRSLQALFLHSWAALTAIEREALPALTVFRGGFTEEAAYRALKIVPATLRALTAKSLLHLQNGRYAIHALIRQLAAARLPQDAAVYANHARYFSRQLQTISDGALTASPDALLGELDNIRVMWQYAVARRDMPLLRDATHDLARLYAVANLFTEGRLLFGQAVEALEATAVPQTEPLIWGNLLGRYAVFLFRTGRLPETRDIIERSVAVLRQTDDEEALAFSLNLLGTLHIQSGEFETAVALLTECADLYRCAANSAPLLKPLINLGSVYTRTGDHAAAIAHLNEALPLAQELGDRRGMTHILNNLGANHLILGELDAAHGRFAACLPLTEETAYQPVRLAALQNMAEVAYKRGEWEQALADCEASLAIAAEIGGDVQAIRTQKVQAMALYALGEEAQAWNILRDAVETGFQAQALPALMDVLEGVGALLLDAGQTAFGIELLQFICAHPATEGQFVRQAEKLLAEAGAAMEDGEERELEGMITAVCAKISSANV